MMEIYTNGFTYSDSTNAYSYCNLETKTVLIQVDITKL
jgi:hypothetical protein